MNVSKPNTGNEECANSFVTYIDKNCLTFAISPDVLSVSVNVLLIHPCEAII